MLLSCIRAHHCLAQKVTGYWSWHAKNEEPGTFLLVHWLRIHPATQGHEFDPQLGKQDPIWDLSPHAATAEACTLQLPNLRALEPRCHSWGAQRSQIKKKNFF